MNTAIQHSLDSTNLSKEVVLLSSQELQIQSIQSGIRRISQKVKGAADIMKEKRDEFLENQSKYFEIIWHRLERQNHGAPECRDIALNEEKASKTKPQAWSQLIDGVEHWYYNYPGALKEAEFLGKKIPTIEEWMEMLASIPGTAEEKAEVLGISLAGYRNANTDGFSSADDYANLWSSSPDISSSSPDITGYAHCVFWVRGNPDANRNLSFREHGLSLRFLSDIK